MGFKESIAKLFKRDKASQAAESGRGRIIDDPTSGEAFAPGGMMKSISEAISIDHALLQRYSDYEDMDDYPELCLAGESLIFTLKDGWITIKELADRDESFHVISYDKDLRSLVPAEAHSARITGKNGHSRQMVRVVLDNGQSIKCTEDHLFLTKNEKWVAAKDLVFGKRLMPGCLRMRALNTDVTLPYWEVHQPHSDSFIRSSDGKRWTWIHKLVGNCFLESKKNDIIHHIDYNSLNNDPINLSIEDISSHAFHHIALRDNTKYFPEWTDERRLEMSKRMKGNKFRIGKKDSDITKKRKSIASKGRRKSKECRERIGLAQPNRIDIPIDKLEAALMDGVTIAGAARILGVSWSKMKRDAEKYDLLNDDGNHRVLKVEYISSKEEIYDLTVPQYHNFICNGVVVHNSSSLDIMADDSTIPDSVRGKSIWAESKDNLLRNIINDCLHRRLRIEDDIWIAVRTLCKYGSLFAEIVVTDRGVVGLNFLPVPTVRRLVDVKGNLIGYLQDMSGRFGISINDDETAESIKKKAEERGMVFFEPWEIVHWRLRSKFIQSLYGWSTMEAARWIWKRLVMLEDTSLIYMLSRSPGRYIFYVDTGDLPPAEANAVLKKARRQYKKRTLVNPSTGEIDFRHNALSPEDDVWVATRGGKESSRVEVLSGPDWQSNDSIEYFREKMFTALKIPRSYYGGDAEAEQGLAQKDVRFARTCMRVQREFKNGIRQIVRVHLAALNIDPDTSEWEMRMTVPSSIFELQQIEVMNAQAGLIETLSRHFSKEWLLQNVLHMSQDDAVVVVNDKSSENEKEINDEARVMAMIQRKYPGVEIQSQDNNKTEDIDVSKKLDKIKESVQETIKTSNRMLKKVEEIEPGMKRNIKSAMRNLDIKRVSGSR